MNRQTRLIIFSRPDNSIKKPLTTIATGTAQAPIGLTGSYFFQYKNNLNNVITNQTALSVSDFGRELDLYEDVSIPVNFTISDIREPDKIKTNWSKSIKLPGTKRNNRIFSHFYDLGTDNWITIGQTSVWQNFNPNFRTEVVLMNGDVEVLKGNLQLKAVTKDRFGNIEYDVALSGQLTSLFSDLDNTKLKDLDFSEFDHTWSKDNIVNSWNYVNYISGGTQSVATLTPVGTYVKGIFKSSEGRLGFTTQTNHGLSVGDYVRIDLDTSIQNRYKSAQGEWIVMTASSTQFAVNYFYPVALSPTGETPNTNIGQVKKVVVQGRGYVYPMVQWGDETDHNSWPVTSFAPGYYIKGLIDKIFEATNSSYQSTFLTSQFFKRLVYIQKKSQYDINPADIKSRKFQVGLTGSYHTLMSAVQPNKYQYLNLTTANTTATASSLPSQFANRIPFQKESGFSSTQSFFDMGATQSGQIGNWDEDNYKWIVRENGEYAITANVSLTCWCDMNGYSGSATSSGTSSFVQANKYYPGNRFGFLNYGGGLSPTPDPSSSFKSASCGVRVVAKMILERKGVQTIIGEVTTDQFYMNRDSFYATDNTNWPYFGRYQPQNWQNFQITIPCNNYYFSKGDEVWCEMQYYVQARQEPGLNGVLSTNSFVEIIGDQVIRAVRGDWHLQVNSQSFIFNEPTPKSTEGSTLYGNSFFSNDLTCRDFLLSICKMFNLYIEADRDVERKYKIEPRDDYFKTGSSATDFIDWSAKLDETSVQILPMSEFVSKNYTFKYKEETDYWNTKFKNERGRIFGLYRKTIANDFQTSETTIDVSQFASTVMINYPQSSDVVMPSIISKEGNSNQKPVSNPSGRILIWGGLRPYTAYRGGAEIDLQNPQTSHTTGFEIVSSEIKGLQTATFGVPYHQYPYAGTVDSPHDPYYDINWFNMELGDFVYYDFARWSNVNLYNQYYSNMVRELSDPGSRVLVANFALTPSDIQKVDFSKIYLVGGHWMRLQRVIDFDPVSSGLTKCELLKLNRPTRFKRQSLIVDAYGSVADKFDGLDIVSQKPITLLSDEAQYAPSKKRPNYGFVNVNPQDELSSNATQTLNGQSNYIAPSAKNINVNGNENSIGSNTNNINISSGDANFITGGVKNINLIGTSKKYINESDVTYINGIRYKLGSAISKSQVIDASQDISLQKSSDNTIINVIDAGEDVVTFGGSSGFENTIDAGSDRILPDLPELGIGTLTNPNPRTNASGGFIIENPTFSTIELIRRTNYLKS